MATQSAIFQYPILFSIGIELAARFQEIKGFVVDLSDAQEERKDE